MATPQQASKQRQIADRLQGEGYVWRIDQWPGRMTWYKTTLMRDDEHPEGHLVEVAMPGLPSDPWHMERYLERGYRPDLPRGMPVVTSAPVPVASQAPQEMPQASADLQAVVVPEGFTETPPRKNLAGVPCPQCGVVCKGNFGLTSHLKKHKKE